MDSGQITGVAVDDELHASWCTGAHDRDGECLIECPVGEDMTVVLQAVPCSHANLWADGFLYDVTQLDALMAELLRLRPLLAAADAEASCAGHHHEDEG